MRDLFEHFNLSLCFKAVGLIGKLSNIADTFWIRVKAFGPCAARHVAQFAVLSYKPLSTDGNELAFSTRQFPDYSQPFGNGGVSFQSIDLKQG